MKIGIYDPYLDDIGGGEKYMMNIASCLAIEHAVDVFWDNKRDIDEVRKRFSIDFSRVTLTKNIFNSEISKLEKLKNSRNYDLIIVLSDGSIPLLFSKKLYLHLQQPIIHNLSVKDKLKLRKVNKIFVNSTFTKNFIEKNYNTKCTLLYPPVSIYGNNTIKDNLILHVGRFRIINNKSEDYKKQQFMINTFKKMINKGLKDWKLIMAISLSDKNDKRFLKMKHSAQDYPIEFLINSSKDKLWEKAGKAKIYWHATGYGENLKRNPELAEHFGISTAEAMGAGIVPVVFSAGGQKEIVENNKNGLLWVTEEEFIEKTNQLIVNKKLISKLSKEAYSRSKYFSEKNFCKRVFNLIND